MNTADMARRGTKGGNARMAALSPEQRSEIARMGAKARWSNPVNFKTNKDQDALVVTVRLRSGRFESSIETPALHAEEQPGFVSAFVALVTSALETSRSAPTTPQIDAGILTKTIGDYLRTNRENTAVGDVDALTLGLVNAIFKEMG